MKYLFGMVLFLAGCGERAVERREFPIRLITLDPGHFHAALVQKSDYPEMDTVVHVYAPAGQEVEAHLGLVKSYNKWKEIVYTGPDFLEHMFKERAGNVVVLAGNNKRKIDYIKASVDSGFNVFADKPMIIEPGDFSKLEEAFAVAERNKVVLYDIMTERYQVTTILQRLFSQMPEVFGQLQKGTVDDPAVTKESVHHFFKSVSGKPLIRPSWYFDVRQEGEGIVDVTTHLVDLIQWECFPDSILDYKKDIAMLSARRWPTVLRPSEFQRVTGLSTYPDFLAGDVKDSLLSVYANGEMNYTLKGVHAKVSVRWDFQAPEGSGDTHYSVLRGTLANLIIRQDPVHHYKPVLSVEPVQHSAAYEDVLVKAMGRLQDRYPGLALVKTAKGWEVVVPDIFSPDHEATFAKVTKKYLGFVQSGVMPNWEVANMLAKYYTTMKALEMARGSYKSIHK
jgi:predicted dehydrogenase